MGTTRSDHPGGYLFTDDDAYPSFLEDVPFDPNDVNRVCQTEAGGHAYRGITFPLEEAERTYLQVLVNVDAELAILDGFTRTLVLYLAAAVVAAAAASYLLSRRTLKPIVQNWKAQTEFVQNASHELRTPLAVVQATGELLLDHPESRIVDRFEDVNVITEETKRLARLVDSLMELSLDDAGRAQPNRQPVEVDGLVRDVAALYEDFVALQGKQVRFEPGFGGTVPADADRLRQLLAIVLDNAVKYTAAGDEIVVTTGSPRAEMLSDGGRHRMRHRPRGPRTRLRALLPRRQGPVARHRRARPGALACPKHRAGAWRHHPPGSERAPRHRGDHHAPR